MNENNNRVKLIAFHLPQFHTFPENDEWWGEGFTEWTNTKKAIKVYPEHNQPREPLDDHYYDLSNLDEMLGQMRLAEKYGVYGFCYYHYWFNGKLLLHKPLELIRDYEGHKLPYCLCWANEPWTRTWEGKEATVLMPQEYGNEKEWEEHFRYLLKFFRDNAYIKIKGAPLLVIYRTNSIYCAKEMCEYFVRRTKEEGFPDLFLVEEINCYQIKPETSVSKAILQFEPLYSMTEGRSLSDKLIYKIQSIFFNKKYGSNSQIYGYDRLWKRVIANAHKDNDEKEFFAGAFVDWDNTARKGKNGRIVLGCSPEKFGYYLKRQKEKAASHRDRFVFINAWNEWGEGTYLEPDKNNKYKYLEEVKKVFGTQSGSVK
ncbi:glycoside hydrolase family 99-like domain-containing protein [Lacrimispora saccharolytica]|nr:glycoside hydrolase family 99-like domain-containing protein [Lacrimispora saccharolytica]